MIQRRITLDTLTEKRGVCLQPVRHFPPPAHSSRGLRIVGVELRHCVAAERRSRELGRVATGNRLLSMGMDGRTREAWVTMPGTILGADLKVERGNCLV